MTGPALVGRIPVCPECGGAWLPDRYGCANSWCDAYARPACDHCHDDPPKGHTCPRCGRRALELTEGAPLT